MTKQINKSVSISLEAAKRHSKRMLKVLNEEYSIISQITNKPIALHDAQEIFAKSIGCNNWYEFNEIAKKNINSLTIDNNDIDNQKHKNLNLFTSLEDFEIANIIMTIKGGKKEDMWTIRADMLILALIPALLELQDYKECFFNIDTMIYYLNLDNVIKLYKLPYLSSQIRGNLKTYLMSLPGFQEAAPIQSETTFEQHGYLKMQILPFLTLLKQASEQEIVLYDKKWDIIFTSKEKLGQAPYELLAKHQEKVVSVRSEFKYESELWIDKMQDDINFPTLNNLYLKNKNKLTLNDLILNLINLNIYDHEINFIVKLIKNHQRVNKISLELEACYLKIKNEIGI